jgi:hypothetical protein
MLTYVDLAVPMAGDQLGSASAVGEAQGWRGHALPDPDDLVPRFADAHGKPSATLDPQLLLPHAGGAEGCARCVGCRARRVEERGQVRKGEEEHPTRTRQLHEMSDRPRHWA